MARFTAWISASELSSDKEAARLFICTDAVEKAELTS